MTVRRIYIADCIPSFNKGEAAILKGMLHTFGLLGDYEVWLASLTPGTDSWWYGDAVHIVAWGQHDFTNRLGQIIWAARQLFAHSCFAVMYGILGHRVTHVMRSPQWSSYLASHLIIVGHDNVFVGNVPPNFYVIPFAKILGKPVVVYGASVGPFKNWLSHLLIRWVLNQADLITLRDELSLKCVHEMNLSHANVHLTADLAFLLEPADSVHVDNVMQKEDIDSGVPLIGFTSTAAIAKQYSLQSIRRPADRYDAYLRLKASVIDRLVEETGAIVLLLSHCIGAGRGIRLMPETESIPKCMMGRVGGQRVLDWILDSLTHAGIDDVVFIGGYHMEKVVLSYPHLRFYENTDCLATTSQQEHRREKR